MDTSLQTSPLVPAALWNPVPFAWTTPDDDFFDTDTSVVDNNSIGVNVQPHEVELGNNFIDSSNEEWINQQG